MSSSLCVIQKSLNHYVPFFCCSFTKQQQDATLENSRLLATPESSCDQTSALTHTRGAIVDADFSQGVTSICGVLLHTLGKATSDQNTSAESKD